MPHFRQGLFPKRWLVQPAIAGNGMRIDRIGLVALSQADFYRRDGSSVAMLFEAEDVALVSDSCPVRIPQEVLEFWKNANDAKST